MIPILQIPNPVATLSTSLTTSSLSASGTGSGPFSTGSVFASVTGGVSPYTYLWSRVSGDATIGVNDSGAASVFFSASGTAPETKNAIWKCTVTDARGIAVDSSTVSVSVSFQTAAITVNLSASTASASGTGSGPFTTAAITATPSGGTGPYTYAWTLASGDSSITPSSSSAQNPTFSASGTAPQTKTASYICTATDSLGSSGVSSSVAIDITFSVASLSVTLDTYTLSGSLNGTGYNDTPTVTATPSGGTAPYTYLWQYVSGDSSIFTTTPTEQQTDFSRYGSYTNTYVANWRCRVTDSASTVAYSSNVTITLNFNPP